MEETIQTQTPGREEPRAQIKNQNQQLRLLAQLAADLLAAKNPDQLVKDLFQHLSHEFQIDVGFNYMVVEEGKELQLKAYTGIPPSEAERIQRLQFGQAICGLVAANREPMYVAHVQESTLPHAQLVRQYGIRAYACQPLIADGRLIGTISFATRHRDTFHDAELSFFRTISLYVSLAKERLRAEEALRAVNETLEEKVEARTAQVRRLAQQLEQAEQEERARLARDLHDSAGQLLTALVLNLQLLEGDSDKEEVREAIAEARHLATDAHREIRTVSHALRPPALELNNLHEALGSLCDDFGQQTGIEIQFVGDETPDVGEHVTLTYYRFLQEGLANAARHANANQIQVHLRCDGTEITLSVEDDGDGFSPHEEQRNGVGLRNLRERFELIGGKMELASSPGGGTRLTGRYYA